MPREARAPAAAVKSQSVPQSVLIVGAGPAGSAAARVLAQAGVSVSLVDQSTFPRDKTCGDGLIPDAFLALRKLGLEARVRAEALPLAGLRVIAPDGREVDLAGDAACLPRLRLDALMRDAAEEAGARFLAPLRLKTFVEEAGRITGAHFTDAGGTTQTLQAPITLLATGAATAPLAAAGLLLRKEASGFALRGYYRHPRLAGELDRLVIAIDREVRGGYGWIFPGPDGVFNVGVGLFGGRDGSANVRRVFERFVAHSPLARALVEEGETVAAPRGAPLRTCLTGARFSRPGLLAIGETVGTTYAFTGEGIGKAIESGIAAAQAILDAPDEAALARDYAARLDVHAARYAAYRKAQYWLSWPAVSNRLAERAARGGRVKRALEGLLAETIDPSALFTVRNLLRGLLSG
ncbi:FAD-dependent monooxygenase [Niveibacterium sp. SC-1]|uniref:NAD(P)/FAD-dependent oxidoreductase n=1 Tax=Niveibacterium sp. SC-1 TaxID=3135646 RepID=UPI003120488E